MNFHFTNSFQEKVYTPIHFGRPAAHQLTYLRIHSTRIRSEACIFNGYIIDSYIHIGRAETFSCACHHSQLHEETTYDQP